jgi:dTDP-4-amino-4,6-dideoxygalactose transaminase
LPLVGQKYLSENNASLMINVTKTYLPDKARFQVYLDQIYASGWLTNNGILVQRLEEELKKFLHAEYVILTVNGTCALQLAYKMLGLTGEVITTPFTFVATVSSLVWEGLTPVFVDIDENTLNINPEKITEKITDKTSAILPVHVFGNVCDVEKIGKIASDHHLNVLYDAAHAFDVQLGDKNVSEFGDVSVYSFHSTKIFHTIEGGAVVVKSKELYEKGLLMRNFGIPGYDRITELGVNFKMNEFQAAMGLCVFDDFKAISVERKEVFNRYHRAFREQKKVRLQQVNKEVTRNFSYFPVIFKSEERLTEVKDRLNKDAIYPRRYFYPSLNELPYLKDRQSVPIAESIASRILCLPLFHDLNQDIQDQIIETVNMYS